MRDCFAEAQEESLVCEATRSDVESLIAARPEVAFRLLEVFGRRVLDLEERLEQLAYQSVAARLAALLLHWAERHGDRCTALRLRPGDLTEVRQRTRLSCVVVASGPRVTFSPATTPKHLSEWRFP